MTKQQPSNIRSLQVSAPGKLVIWGEYAVLVGAQAGVLAVDRYATCRITPNNDNQWQLTTQGFTSEPTSIQADWFASALPPSPNHPGALLWHAAQANQWLPKHADLPNQGAQIHLDSSAFYHDPISEVPTRSRVRSGQKPIKLGLGSSAAVCTALTHLCAELKASKEHPATNLHTLPKALAAHKAVQQGAGSGIDVAASSLGGLLRYKLGIDSAEQSNQPSIEPIAEQIPWPEALHWQAFWTGSPASTTDHLKRFDAWRAQGHISALTRLVTASQDCSELLDLNTLAHYVAALRRFDTDSQVGIYSQAHEDLHKLASDIGVIYKPCGAGGGDLGIAFAADPAQLQRFAATAAAHNIVQIRLEMANHGVRTQTVTAQAGNHQPNP